MNTTYDAIARYGTIEFSGYLWRDEVILHTDLSFDEVMNLSFVLAIKNLQ